MPARGRSQPLKFYENETSSWAKIVLPPREILTCLKSYSDRAREVIPSRNQELLIFLLEFQHFWSPGACSTRKTGAPRGGEIVLPPVVAAIFLQIYVESAKAVIRIQNKKMLYFPRWERDFYPSGCSRLASRAHSLTPEMLNFLWEYLQFANFKQN